MSLMVDGQLRDDWLDELQQGGEFVRKDSQFRHWITPDGRPGPSGEGGFAAEAGRYHLYVSLACPWANRTLIFRAIKGLEDIISVDVVDPYMPDSGWFFADRPGGGTADSVNGFKHAHQLYSAADPNYSGIVTVPVLWDKQRRTIVNNESAEIIRMLNSAFAGLADTDYDYYPQALRGEIDAINATVYENVNNGVYRCGFATTQNAYEKAFQGMFGSEGDEQHDREGCAVAKEKVRHDEIYELEQRLSRQRYLVGDRLTEADWRLFTTLVRFDAVYYLHFKCNRNRIADFPNLSGYLRELYQFPGVAATVDMDEIKQHYYRSHVSLNPTGLVPLGPRQDLEAPHDRDRFG